MSLKKLLSHWRAEPTIFENIYAWRKIPARSAQFEPFPNSLNPNLTKVLSQKGIDQLFLHQRLTWDYTEDDKNVIIVTGTASGKTLAYNLPILNTLLQIEEARALYLFPTKALGQDQFNELQELTENLAKSNFDSTIEFEDLKPHANFSVPVAVYDGDTKPKDRPAIRDKARILITNPDMLHLGILPHHTQWAEFFGNLNFIVIDEIHVYRGVFGSHVANVIRRLKRIADFYGSHPKFFLTSATISNPLELGEKLIEESLELVNQDGSSQGPRNFIIYNPPLVDPELGLRRSSLLESVRLAEDLIHYGVQTIIFGRSRRAIELILTYLQEKISARKDSSVPKSEDSDDSFDIIRGYRSGYLPSERRAIEEGLRTGKIRAVVATNALELGIDIGEMSASILSGYPGTIASTWQQAGRAGRGEDISLIILITTASPLDQFLAHHPNYFFGRSPEQALINPDNLLILLGHLKCAVFELPFENRETYGNLTQKDVNELFAILHQEGILHRSGDKFFWMSEHYPANDLSLRIASPNRIMLQFEEEGKWITFGEVDYQSASWLVHPQAIYLQESRMYFVDELDFERGVARAQPISVDYYTIPKVNTNIELISISKNSGVHGGEKFLGEILVSSQVTGYKQVKWFTHEQIGEGELDLPTYDLNTMGYWISIDPETVEKLREDGLWSNDPNNYGPSWSKQKDLARARDEYQCQVCRIEEVDKAHHVHHRTPFRQFESPQQANQLPNLITLCASCHQRVENAIKLRSGLSGLAFILNQIAPIILMCDSKDLGVYSEPQSSLAEGNPSIVLFERIPAGIGFSQRLYENHERLIRNSLRHVEQCLCSDGCPSCVGPAGENGTGGKRETIALLKLLLEKEFLL
jgi:DEAD/DEAH box helicase domain-containing protein